MLVGAPPRPDLPRVPDPSLGLEGIYNYLRELDPVLQNFVSTLVRSTVGMIGVRGLSATGTLPQNFTKSSLDIGNQTSVSWVFTNMESDASYMIFYSPSVNTGVVLTSLTRATTNVSFRFNPVVPSGVLMDILLLR